MAFSSAAAGNLMIPGSPVVTIPNARWSASWRAMTPNVTQSSGLVAGATLYQGTIQDNTWEWRCARDDTNYPEAVGFVPGVTIAELHFKLGSTSKTDKIVYTTVESVDPECDSESGEVIRVTIRGKGGLVTKNQTPPS